jgi:hypothetical protein
MMRTTTALRDHTAPFNVHFCTTQRDLKNARQDVPGFAWRMTAAGKQALHR